MHCWLRDVSALLKHCGVLIVPVQNKRFVHHVNTETNTAKQFKALDRPSSFRAAEVNEQFKKRVLEQVDAMTYTNVQAICFEQTDVVSPVLNQWQKITFLRGLQL
eukprot:1316752-Amphidinium_carterae.1